MDFKRPKSLLPLFTVIFLIFLLIIIFIIPLSVSSKITVFGKILPRNEFFVIGTNSGYKIMEIDNLTGLPGSVREIIPERGDQIYFYPMKNSLQSGKIPKGDTLGYFKSISLEEKILKLEGELSQSLATLKFYKAGAKPSVIEEARRKLEYARQKAEDQSKIVERVSELYKKNLISREEYELEKNRKELYDIKVSIAEADLRTVSTGATPEEVEIVESRIAAIKKELKFQQTNLKSLIILSPFKGNCVTISGSDTLIHLSSPEEMLLMLPVDAKYFSSLRSMPEVEIFIQGDSQRINGKIVRIIPEIFRVGKKEKIIVIVKFINRGKELLRGEKAKCRISPSRKKLISVISDILR